LIHQQPLHKEFNMARSTTFTKGSGCYDCRICGRATRDDGNGDAVHIQACTQCFELGGIENDISDNGATPDLIEAAKSLFDSIKLKGGRPSFGYKELFTVPATTTTKEEVMTPVAPAKPAKKAPKQPASAGHSLIAASIHAAEVEAEAAAAAAKPAADTSIDDLLGASPAKPAKPAKPAPVVTPAPAAKPAPAPAKKAPADKAPLPNTLHELGAVHTSILSAIGRGRRANNARQIARMARYDALRLEAMKLQDGYAAFCKANALPEDHTALTIFQVAAK
jgi:hypothetical protein